MPEFRMPSLGADMESGIVARWLVKPGDTVARGDIVAEVDTDKATIEVEIFEAGVVDAIVVPEGERVPVGTVLATLRAAGGEAAGAAPEAAGAPAAGRAALPAAVPAVAAAPAPARGSSSVAVSPDGAVAASTAAAGAVVTPVEEGRGVPRHVVEASPLARRMAAMLGLDIARVHGTGPGGAVTRADVQMAAERAAPAVPAPLAVLTPAVEAPPATVVPAAGAPSPPATVVPAAGPPDASDRRAAMRRATGALMARSKREIPHYYLGSHVDMSRALAWLTETNLERSVAERLIPAVLVLKAVALGAREVPEVNGFWVDGGFHRADGVHLGVAVSQREGGLIAPAIHDVDAKGLDELMRDLRGLVERARTGRLRSSEMSDPTLTVTNLGDQGVETVYGVIYAPQVALVGVGRIVERPWAENGMVGARPVVHVTLSADHRVSDGHRGARFLAAVDRHLQEPESL